MKGGCKDYCQWVQTHNTPSTMKLTDQLSYNGEHYILHQENTIINKSGSIASRFKKTLHKNVKIYCKCVVISASRPYWDSFLEKFTKYLVY